MCFYATTMRSFFVRSPLSLLLASLLFACSGAEGGADELGDPGDADPNGGSETGAGGDDTGGSMGNLDGGGTTGGDPANSIGKGSTNPFNPKEEGSQGVKVDPDGNIVIDPSTFGGSAAPIIWVANSEEGTVSKVDTRSMKELARYKTGPGSSDPSRTTVSLNGDVVVVNRGGASATKIASNAIDCVGPGTGTSTGPTDVKAWGDDKCVLWNTPFAAGSLARAGAFDAEKGLDGELSVNVWVGLWTRHEMLKLDSKTGKILATISVAPLQPYGAAIDASHRVWVWSSTQDVGYIDATTNKFTNIGKAPCGYGIAVDPKGRVFTAGWTTDATQGCIARYTPSTGKWDSKAIPGSIQGRGLAIDNKGSLWFADTTIGAHQVNTETLDLVKNIPLGTAKGFTGMALDFDGKVWAIGREGSEAFKIDPVTYAATAVKVGLHPYTYSDMTGYQLRNAAAPFGKYVHMFKGCGATAKWISLNWKASAPNGTTITIRARTGKDPAAVRAAAWIVVGKVPGDMPPIDLQAKLGDLSKGEYIEVEFRLESVSLETTPILSSIDAVSTCPPAIN